MPFKLAGEVLTAMVRMFSTGVGDLEEIIHPDYLDHQGFGEGALRGLDAFTTVVTVARSGYTVLEVAVEDLVEQGNRAAARLSWRGIRPSGELVERETLEIIHVRDGLAVEHWGGRS